MYLNVPAHRSETVSYSLIYCAFVFSKENVTVHHFPFLESNGFSFIVNWYFSFLRFSLILTGESRHSLLEIPVPYFYI